MLEIKSQRVYLDRNQDNIYYKNMNDYSFIFFFLNVLTILTEIEHSLSKGGYS